MKRSTAFEILDRMPPSDLDAETGLLSAVLIDPTTMDCASRTLTGPDFYDSANGALFSALAMLRDAGKLTTDTRVTIPQLRSLHVSELQWSIFQIGNLIAAAGSASNVPLYADRIRRLSVLRHYLDTATLVLTKVHEPDAEPENVARWIEGQLDNANSQRTTESRLIGAVAADVLADIEDGSAHCRGIMTGLQSVDECTGGMMAGELIVIGARPGNGKTSLGAQIALHNARKNRQVLFVSLEMTEKEIARRIMCSISKIDSRRVRSGTLTPGERRELIEAGRQLHDLPFHIWAPPTALTSDIRAMARLRSKITGLELLLVDYIGLVKASDPRRQRHEQVGEVTIGLKSLAKELSVPVVALCQLNREAEKGAPTLAMLRESGNIEQDADQVWFLHHEAKNEPVNLIIAKHRHGDVGCLPLNFIAQETRFEEIDNRDRTLSEWNDQ